VRRNRSSIQDEGAVAEAVCSKRNLSAHATTGRKQQLVVGNDDQQHGQYGVADRGQVLLLNSERNIGTDAGKVTVVLPTVIASDATTKNQPPDIDIIVFQIRPASRKVRRAARSAAIR